MIFLKIATFCVSGRRGGGTGHGGDPPPWRKKVPRTPPIRVAPGVTSAVRRASPPHSNIALYTVAGMTDIVGSR